MLIRNSFTRDKRRGERKRRRGQKTEMRPFTEKILMKMVSLVAIGTQ